jgi:hypothetical protein
VRPVRWIDQVLDIALQCPLPERLEILPEAEVPESRNAGKLSLGLEPRWKMYARTEKQPLSLIDTALKGLI